MKNYDYVIIGAGPGGYVAAIRAAQLKKNVLLIEKEKIGGTCMNWGCIPAKFLLHHSHIYEEISESGILKGPADQIRCDWEKVQDKKNQAVSRLIKGIEFLLKKNHVDIIRGTAHFQNQKTVSVDTKKGTVAVKGNHFILATGSRPFHLPFLKPDGEKVITSREALELSEIPKHLLVVGAGAIGLEIGTVYHRLGSEVRILELMDQILPGSDKELAVRMRRILKKQGLRIHTKMKIDSADLENDQVSLSGTDMEKEEPFEYQADTVLLAAGRRPNSEDLLKEIPDLKSDKNGFIQTDRYFRTGVPEIYAIGDLIGGKLLAHKASHEGIAAVENAAGKKHSVDYHALPLAVFTEPEFASVGPTEEEAEENYERIQTGVFPLQANGRALTMNRLEGTAKIIADQNGKVIAGHILAPAASELIAEVTLAIKKGIQLDEISSTIHIHPTLSESVMEAALAAENRAVHILNR